MTDEQVLKLQTIEQRFALQGLGAPDPIIWPSHEQPLLSASAASPVYDLARAYYDRRPNQVLVVTNDYPSEDSLYANAFIHQRVRHYRARGVEVDVLVFNKRKTREIREHEGVRILSGYAYELEYAAFFGKYQSIIVHFLNAGMWSVLGKLSTSTNIVVVIHGFEAQRWIRRDWQYLTRDSLATALRGSANLRLFWSHLFKLPSRNLAFVFVSRWFMWAMIEDMEVIPPRARRFVVPNVIDTDVFQTHDKVPEDRFKILMIRSFAKANYANDLSVQAILDVLSRPGGERFRFTIFGDGALFESTLAPLRKHPQIEIHQRFLNQAEMVEQHRRHGVFLIPSRTDTQGVSRDEAMSSGLVPITSAAGAIPEFADDSCAVLAPVGDWKGLADGIVMLGDDPERFLAMSRTAAARIRATLGPDHTVARELELLDVA